MRLVAIADPNAKHRAAFDELCGQSNARYYDCGAQLLEREELDALVIASPNHAHARDALFALEKRLTKFMRGGWRRESKMSGGFLIEKCSHDFDILRWL